MAKVTELKSIKKKKKYYYTTVYKICDIKIYVIIPIINYHNLFITICQYIIIIITYCDALTE